MMLKWEVGNLKSLTQVEVQVHYFLTTHRSVNHMFTRIFCCIHYMYNRNFTFCVDQAANNTEVEPNKINKWIFVVTADKHSWKQEKKQS